MADEPTPADVADASIAFRDEYDDGREALESILAVDADHDTWTFEDVPLDSGTFGELVSRGIVTNVDGEYRVSSRTGVRAGLDGTELSDGPSRPSISLSSPVSIDVRAVGALLASLALLFGMRVLNYRSVMRGDHVVSPANDPYYYRYWMEELLAESDGVTDASVLASMPDGTQIRPLTHATNWFFAELLGGDAAAADLVAAWLPVVATLALGVVVYWLAVVLTDDVRVGVASVVFLALTPAHAVYTGIGFLEHRAHQYLWLGVTMLALAWLAVDLERRRARHISTLATEGVSARSADRVSTDSSKIARGHLLTPWTWIAAAAFGVALAFFVHAWGGSVLLLIPVAAYVGLKVALDVRAGLSPVPANLPVLVGLGLGSALAAGLHLRLGWHESFVAAVPALVVAGAVAVTALGALWHRLEWPAGGLVGLQVILAGGGLYGFRQVRPVEWSRLLERADDLFFRESAVETKSLFAAENAVIFEPIIQMGLSFYLGLLVLGWACWRALRGYRPGWLLVSTVALFWLALATVQGRFAGQLSVPLSVLSGLGFVYLLGRLELARLPAQFRSDGDDVRKRRFADERSTATDGGGRATATTESERGPSIVFPRSPRTIVALFWIALLICGMGLIYAPSLSAQTAHDDAQFDAAMAIDEHATEADREYPANFVLSSWGDNRMYNYFVSGESASYSYARATFDEFRTDGDPDGWYEEFDGEVGYVVLTDAAGDEDSAQAQLHGDLGAGGDETEPLEHYQLLHRGDGVTAFAVVPGATIETSGDPGETVTVATDVTVSGEQLAYERDATVDDDGTLAVTVPYPGEYEVGDRTVEVTPEAVETGSSVELE
ncbi:MFS transporter [Natrarchaeobius chitinivorans]|uniref:dolichyl-phosphooligosaccharide-protein glycotransferase n=1 Tax=Natrarchaeobius chitinivorans TaxID=1679083 RepID=A0A3N6PBB6_NATCH|nr:MFS transporter [Natrarchaeobius chitinivorans]RQG93825.1 MFS transporter [Natrarchaeobius chitinivorans]